MPRRPFPAAHAAHPGGQESGPLPNLPTNSDQNSTSHTHRETLAEWATASRIHRTGGSGPEDTPPPAPPAP